MTTPRKPATPLPFVLCDPQSGLITKDWAQIPHGALSNNLCLEEKREVVRRANVYPRLVDVARAVIQALDGDRTRFGKLDIDTYAGDALRDFAVQLHAPGARDNIDQTVNVLRLILRELGEYE